jgi:hypothetical protein
MRLGYPVVPILLLALAAPGQPSETKSKRPRLDMRATPRIANTSPSQVLVVAQLVGGDETEEFYCPGLEWDWGDGARSSYESDCPPFEPGMELVRRFSARHAYRQPGDYEVRITLRRADRSLAAARASVSVLGAGGSEFEPAGFPPPQ